MNNTSNYPNPNKKIKPIEHPELVLKSPIAYHGGTDLSVIPIDKDGIGKYTFFFNQMHCMLDIIFISYFSCL